MNDTYVLVKISGAYDIQELVPTGRFILFLQWLSVVGAVIILTWQISSLKDWKAIQLDQSPVVLYTEA